MPRRVVGCKIALLLLPLLLCSAAMADVTLTSFTETVHTFIRVQVSATTLTDEDTNSIPAAPPASISTNSVTAFGASAGAGTASVTVHSYSGPAGIGLSSPSLSIDCDTFGMVTGNNIVNDNPLSYADAVLEMAFTLDDFHPYTYAKSGSGFGSNAFFHSGGPAVAEGSGLLSPGQYGFSVSSVGSGGGLHTIDLTIGAPVPEPTTLALLAPAAVAMCRRRERRRDGV